MARNSPLTLPAPRAINPRQPSRTSVLLSAADFDTLMDEPESLRAARRPEPAPARRASIDGADLMVMLKTAGVDDARIAQVEALIRLASMVGDVVTVKGGAGLGSTVEVADRGGRTTEYVLVGQVGREPAPQRVALTSPTGKALLGARPGDVLHVELPNGRRRRVRVSSVTPDPPSLEFETGAT